MQEGGEDFFSTYSDYRRWLNNTSFFNDRMSDYKFLGENLYTQEQIKFKIEHIKKIENSEICHYCDAKLERFPVKDTSIEDASKKFLWEDEYVYDFDIIVIYQCPSCKWWFGNYLHRIVSCSRKVDTVFHQEGFIEAILKSYRHHDLSTPIKEIRKFVEQKQDNYCLINPHLFEKTVESILRDFYRCEVRHVGKSHDKGIDLIMVHADETYFIQVKRRKNSGTVEGVSPVRELIGSMAINNGKNGIVVTTADKFSLFANNEANSTHLEELNFKLKLIDRHELFEMTKISNTSLKPHWQSIIDNSIWDRDFS